MKRSPRSSFTIFTSYAGRIESALVYGRTGDHPPEMEGVFFAAGDGVVPGRLPAAVRLEDFAPTISRWFGIDLSDTAGAAIANLCTEDGDIRHPESGSVASSYFSSSNVPLS